MKIAILKLGTIGCDKATGLTGMLTHCHIYSSMDTRYLFQPNGINRETGRPVRRLAINSHRFSPWVFEDVEVPVEVIGTQVTDDASGFTGIATSFIRHVNGCLHVVVQPPDRLSKSNEPYPEMEFDLRQCSGEAIKEMSETEKRESKLTAPSPMEHEPFFGIPEEEE